MTRARAFVLLLAAGCCGASYAQSIFNLSPSQPQAAAQRPVQAQIIPAAPASVPLPSAQPGQQAAASSLVDPKVMAQFEQLPNESNDAYLNRLKALSQRAIADMERVSREHNAKMKALAPK